MSLQAKNFRDAVVAQDLLNMYSEFLSILEFIVDYSRTRISSGAREDLESIAQIQKELRSTCRTIYETIKDMDKDALFEKIDRVVALFESLEASVRKDELS